jgi:hypothetical protein
MNLYFTCEQNFAEGIQIYQAILKQKLIETESNQINTLGKISNKLSDEPKLDEKTEPNKTDDNEIKVDVKPEINETDDNEIKVDVKPEINVDVKPEINKIDDK